MPDPVADDAATPYTPPTTQIREYMAAAARLLPSPLDIADGRDVAAAFDRWLAEHDATLARRSQPAPPTSTAEARLATLRAGVEVEWSIVDGAGLTGVAARLRALLDATEAPRG